MNKEIKSTFAAALLLSANLGADASTQSNKSDGERFDAQWSKIMGDLSAITKRIQDGDVQSGRPPERGSLPDCLAREAALKAYGAFAEIGQDAAKMRGMVGETLARSSVVTESPAAQKIVILEGLRIQLEAVGTTKSADDLTEAVKEAQARRVTDCRHLKP